MGYYINQNSKGEFIGHSFQSKISYLIKEGGTKISEPEIWEEGLVCVIDNGMFASAGYAYDEREMNEFKHYGNRNYQWLKLENAKVLAK